MHTHELIIKSNKNKKKKTESNHPVHTSILCPLTSPHRSNLIYASGYIFNGMFFCCCKNPYTHTYIRVLYCLCYVMGFWDGWWGVRGYEQLAWIIPVAVRASARHVSLIIDFQLERVYTSVHRRMSYSWTLGSVRARDVTSTFVE